MATLIGVSRAAKRGLLFKESRMLETMAKATLLALDKTGTITEGKPSVIDLDTHEGFDPALLLALVHSSNHPISQGIESYLLTIHPDLIPPTISQIKSIDAKGITAQTETQRLAGGNHGLMKHLDIQSNFESEHTLFLFAINEQIVATITLQDQIKASAKETIHKFKEQGLKVVMLTGDHQKSAKSIASQIGIDTVYHTLLPTDKAALIDQFHEEGEIVVMAGDGINDAVALAKSDIACAMGSGADIAIEVSDVVLLDDKLESLADAFSISKRTFAAVKQNLGFSILYNTITVPLAVLGHVTPLIAAISMSLSSLVVVANSSRIKLKGDT
jgi:Cu+-exporting ATPase